VSRADARAQQIASLDAGVVRSAPASGVRVVSDHIATSPSLSLACFVGVGSRDESDPQSGSSHFLEHLLFKGTRSRTARQVNRAVDAVGGEFNAYTTREGTVFYLRVPADQFDLASDLLVDVLTEPLLGPDDVEIERQVILEELDAARDSPDDLVFMELAESLFADHPLGVEVLGREASLEAITADEIAEFHQRWYGPTNFVIAGAGALTHEQLESVAARLGDRGAARPTRSAPTSPLRPVAAIARPNEQAHVAIGWHGPSQTDPDRFAFVVLSHVLGDGPSSRLYEEIRERRGLAYAVSSSLATYSDAGTVHVYCATSPEHLGEVRRIVDDTIAALAVDGPDDEELEVAHGYLVGSLLMGLEDSGARMSRVGSSESARGRVVPVADTVASIEAVTAADVRSAARRLIDLPRAVVGVGPVSEADLIR